MADLSIDGDKQDGKVAGLINALDYKKMADKLTYNKLAEELPYLEHWMKNGVPPEGERKAPELFERMDVMIFHLLHSRLEYVRDELAKFNK